MSELAFETRLNSDGSENPKYVDVLDEDKPLSGQKFVCVSFISPENILKQKNHYFFEKFLEDFDFTKSVEKFSQFLNFISFKYSLPFEKLMDDYQEYLKTEKDTFETNYVRDQYKNFLDRREEELDNKFSKEHQFQTNTRGLKVRGSYATQEEAELRCKLLREVDPNHNVYVGPVGMWMPWEPEAYKTGRVEYLEDQLNQLMSEKNKNESAAKHEFDKRIKEAKRDAIQENVKLAKQTGNKLTQNIDEQGNLIGVNNTVEDKINELEDQSQENVNDVLFNSSDPRADRNKN
tara:strand:- start:3518 stop:4390 length:873 start_codon:yes stop_codon:yes gene_type:complete